MRCGDCAFIHSLYLKRRDSSKKHIGSLMCCTGSLDRAGFVIQVDSSDNACAGFKLRENMSYK